MSEINIKQITTESRNQNTMDIDKVSTMEILQKINAEDKKVPLAVERALPQIKLLVDRIVEAFENKGRLIYIGAGTSGRIGVLDASECPPTFGVDQNMVIGLIAGGKQALVKAVEQAEDSKVLAVDDLKEIHLSELDVVVGIAASGRTPYVIGGIEYAQSIGASCGCITTSRESILAKMVDFPIEVITGAEAITGSTRMKSGTAQKLVCNMLTTASMIKLGKVYQNLMVDLKATNEKLVARSIAIICETTDYNKEEATKLFYEYHDVKAVILSYLLDMKDKEKIMRIYLTSVEESKKAEQIQHLVKSLFPNYSVVTIPNKYATEKGKQEVREYSKQYYQKNAEKQRQQRKERYYRQKAEKEKAKRACLSAGRGWQQLPHHR